MMALTEKQRQQIREIFEDLLRRRMDAVERLRLDDLVINPFLLRLIASQMHLHTPEALVRWMLQQRMERGWVTAMGIALQKIARVFARSTGVEGADIMLIREGRHYYIQIKSGPNTVPKDMATQISRLLHSAQRRNRGSVALLGMTYGNKEQVSSIIRQYVDVEWLIGREFWAFLSGDSKCMDEIYTLAGEVGDRYKDPQGRTLAQVFEEKVHELSREFKERFGENLDEIWPQLLEYYA